MSADPAWTALPAARQAAQAGDYATLLRLARTAAGLTLAEAGTLAGYSASTLSRLENGRRRSWNVADLRRLATVYQIPAGLLGLAASTGPADRVSLSADRDEGGDAMRRRDLLAGTAAAAALAPLLPARAGAAAGMADTIEDVLFGRLAAEPLPDGQLAAQIAAARADYRAARYTTLARRLPRLLAHATATRTAASLDAQASAAGRLAQAYAVATQLLTKVHDNGMAWATADRAVQAATDCGDQLLRAETTRLAATVLRRTGHRESAQRLVLHAAQQLRADTNLADPTHIAGYGRLLAGAAYTAAVRDDRDSAATLLGEADDITRHTAADAFNAVDLAVYRISIARVLGDYGAAVDHARRVDPARIVAPERRARYWQDTALALYGRGRPAAAFDALRAAERDAPEEVRYRPWAQQLTRDLLTDTASHRLTGIGDFARRAGVI